MLSIQLLSMALVLQRTTIASVSRPCNRAASYDSFKFQDFFKIFQMSAQLMKAWWYLHHGQTAQLLSPLHSKRKIAKMAFTNKLIWTLWAGTETNWRNWTSWKSCKMNGPQRTACLAKGCINNQHWENGYIPGNVTCHAGQEDKWTSGQEEHGQTLSTSYVWPVPLPDNDNSFCNRERERERSIFGYFLAWYTWSWV